MSFGALKSFNYKLVKRTIVNVRPRAIFRPLINYVATEIRASINKKVGRNNIYVVSIEPSSFCERKCRGCYVSQNEKTDEKVIEVSTALNIVKNGRKWGVRMFNFIGGEPLSMKTTPVITKILQNNPLSMFYCCTNGDFIYSSIKNQNKTFLNVRFSP